MKLPINCMQCFQELGKPTEEFNLAEINNDCVLVSTCSRGHTTHTILQSHKFQILFEFGSMALLDGYAREAITSAAAALERFYEYFINIICLKHKIKKEDFNKTWSKVNSQSERQFGAYLFAYLIDKKGKIAPTIDSKKQNIESLSNIKTKTWAEFRNSVIHKGYIPSTIEATHYMKLIYKHIDLLLKDIKINYEEEAQQSTFNHLFKNSPKKDNSFTSTMSIPVMLDLTRERESFEDALDALKEYKERFHFK